ncbi:helix-turn-helix transcriptional regulator [Gracilibacillus sp. S3-1-1]|uniref:Helix-turn-helix transcriptional regulator n=1 Tax=Gracilibacillus pellucidus TaxID=3095368 RepID=A0ACC6M3A5_9BACI|nr:helix-turn-helix transcriptional regulator [Gracilibacillus sp. S3-1-1]MDX8045378.1 helix-turn-helix transcriptional regulator [Gracilibacillus sp. S3-1-1]
MTNNYYGIYNMVGKNIKKIRLKNRLTQEEFCEQIGVSISYLAKIEAPNCEKKFSLELLFIVSHTFNVDIKELFTFDN